MTQVQAKPLVFDDNQWNALLDQTIKQIKDLAKLKGGEYSGDDDRLANFRRNAADIGLTMEQIWRIYAGKHWGAITQFVKDLGTGKTRKRMEPLSGRADDLIVYLILFKAMLEEREALCKDEGCEHAGTKHVCNPSK